MPVQRIGDLDINQDLVFQRKQWRVQRGAWLVGLLVMLLALMGLFGGGPLATATVSDGAHALTVDYDRIDRRHSPSTLSLEVVPAGAQPTLEVWIDANFLQNVQIQEIEPAPSRMLSDGGRTVLEFELAEPDQRVRISLQIQHEHIGSSRVALGIVDGPEVSFRQFVLP